MKSLSTAKKIISEDNLDVYYWVTGPDSQRTKNFNVLYPGASMNHSSLCRLEEGLNQRGHPTIVLDPRGFGYSRLNKPERKHFSLENNSDDLEKILYKEGIEKPTLIGHSVGFMPIIDYASRTGNAKNIISICASHHFADTAVKLWGTKLPFYLFSNPLIYYLQENIGFLHLINGPEINKWDITRQLEQLDMPLLLLYGNNDIMVTSSGADYISSLVKGKCQVDILEGTHSLPVTHPERVLDALDRYTIESS